MQYFRVAARAAAASTLVLCQPAEAGTPGDGFQVESYAVDLRPDIETTAVRGEQTIRIAALADGLSEIVFSPNALAISDARLGTTPVDVLSREDGIAFRLPRPLARGEEAELHFRFAGMPKRGVTRTPAGLYTGYFACDWMVCLQDAPGDKAAFALDLTLPSGLQSLGVGSEIATVDRGDGLTLHRWRSLYPTSPYLFAFAEGSFPGETVRTRQGTLRYLNGTGEPADLAALFAQTPEMAAFMADRAGVPLPGGSYAQLLAPGREAQETMSFSLIGKGELDRERDDPSSAWVIAHELAHQWWGNLVTTETWRDFWLNEGFATYMVAAWEQHHSGEAAYQQELDIYRDRRAQLQELGWDKPLAWSGKYPSLGVRRAVQYSKGALFLATLRETIGDDAFWDGVRAYTRAHAKGTVTSRDLQAAMERASGRDLDPLFTAWVYGDADGADTQEEGGPAHP